MKRLGFLAILWISTAHAASWSDLWLNRDQQAQRLLDANQPTAAAALFSDARHQAYAQLQAGQYAKAADLLAPFKDANSLYNRGNALAHTGQLRDALEAYDAALVAAPGNTDVIHNRDLVKRALEQQSRNNQQQKGGNSGGNSHGQQGSNGGASSGQGGGQSSSSAGSAGGSPKSQTQAGTGSQANSQPQAGSPSRADSPSGSQANDPSHGNARAANQSESGSPAQARSGPSGPSQANPQAAAASQAPQTSSGTGQPHGSAQSPGPSPSTGSATAENLTQQSGGQTTGTDAETARQDAAAGIQYQQSQARAADPKNAVTRNRLGAVEARGGVHVDNPHPPAQPPSEQSLALDQWLRGIPEDSADLLRRKFLIEHMMRQQGDAQ